MGMINNRVFIYVCVWLCELREEIKHVEKSWLSETPNEELRRQNCYLLLSWFYGTSIRTYWINSTVLSLAFNSTHSIKWVLAINHFLMPWWRIRIVYTFRNRMWEAQKGRRNYKVTAAWHFRINLQSGMM